MRQPVFRSRILRLATSRPGLVLLSCLLSLTAFAARRDLPLAFLKRSGVVPAAMPQPR